MICYCINLSFVFYFLHKLLAELKFPGLSLLACDMKSRVSASFYMKL